MFLNWWMDNQMWYIHAIEYYSTINEVQIPATNEQTLKISYVKEASHKTPHTIWLYFLYNMSCKLANFRENKWLLEI